MLFPPHILNSIRWTAARRACELSPRFTVGITPCKTCVIAAISRGKASRC